MTLSEFEKFCDLMRDAAPVVCPETTSPTISYYLEALGLFTKQGTLVHNADYVLISILQSHIKRQRGADRSRKIYNNFIDVIEQKGRKLRVKKK